MISRPVLALVMFAVLIPAAWSGGTGRSALPDPLTAGWNGEPVCEALVDDDRQRVLRCTFPPGVGHERHFHAPHAGYVLEGGTMRITDERGTRDVEIESGGTWTSAGISWHEVVNAGDSTVSVLVFEPKGSGP